MLIYCKIIGSDRSTIILQLSTYQSRGGILLYDIALILIIEINYFIFNNFHTFQFDFILFLNILKFYVIQIYKHSTKPNNYCSF